MTAGDLATRDLLSAALLLCPPTLQQGLPDCLTTSLLPSLHTTNRTQSFQAAMAACNNCNVGSNNHQPSVDVCVDTSVDSQLDPPHPWHNHSVPHPFCSAIQPACDHQFAVALPLHWMGPRCWFWPPLLPQGLHFVKQSERAILWIVHAQMSQ